MREKGGLATLERPKAGRKAGAARGATTTGNAAATRDTPTATEAITPAKFCRGFLESLGLTGVEWTLVDEAAKKRATAYVRRWAPRMARPTT